jgi:hypothetical protein
MNRLFVGRTPWSARVPLYPLLAQPNQPHAIPEWPTRGSAADQGVRPATNAEHRNCGQSKWHRAEAPAPLWRWRINIWTAF